MAVTFEQQYTPVVKQWADNYIATRRAAIKSKGLVSSGDLEKSLRYKIESDATRGAIKLYIYYRFYGAYYNIPGVKGGRPSKIYTSRLAAWIDRRGRGTFTVGKRNKPVVTTAEVRRVAYAIAKSRQFKVQRRRNWLDLPQAKEVDLLADQIARTTLTIGIEDIKELYKSAGYAVR